jgi:SAM-dependent methyltransferase
MMDAIEAITEAVFEDGKDLDLFDDVAIGRTAFAGESIRALARLLRDSGARPARAEAEISAVATRRLELTIRGRDQFFSFSAAQESAVRAAYGRLREDVARSALGSEDASDRLRAEVIEHRLRLRAAFGRPVRPAPCFYYGAEFQIALLGMDVSSIEEPILDLGCGPDATLVEYLRSLGLEAFGVDRRIGRPGTYRVEADWGAFPLRERSWGAVVSHMAFSNHFIRRHVERDGRDVDLALRYREILRSLSPGGTFYYAPSLPFIERYLDRGEYSVETREVAAGFGASAVRRLGRPTRATSSAPRSR